MLRGDLCDNRHNYEVLSAHCEKSTCSSCVLHTGVYNTNNTINTKKQLIDFINKLDIEITTGDIE